MLMKLSRRIKYGAGQPRAEQMPVVWNGQVRQPVGTDSKVWEDLSCLDQNDVAKMTPLVVIQCPDVEDIRFWQEWSFWRAGVTFAPGADAGDANIQTKVRGKVLTYREHSTPHEKLVVCPAAPEDLGVTGLTPANFFLLR